MAEERDSLWFAFRGEDLLVKSDGAIAMPRAGLMEDLGLDVRFSMEVGDLGGVRCWAVELSEGEAAPGGMEFRDLRTLILSVDERIFAMAGRAKQILAWHRNSRFCGRCGVETGPGPVELERQCPRCAMVFRPRLSPAIIVRVRRADSILLARSPWFAPGLYSLLAGYVDPGESVEETLRREVREEVGIEVENVLYFGSQPWPVSDSLMIGFTADHAKGEITPDPSEIEDAGWYAATDELPRLPPKITIARVMIDDFVNRDPKR
ncbi:MAG: NAD(+) diphosphatase [Rubrobacteraceae bacterium]